jgi:hypothetical protein
MPRVREVARPTSEDHDPAAAGASAAAAAWRSPDARRRHAEGPARIVRCRDRLRWAAGRPAGRRGDAGGRRGGRLVRPGPVRGRRSCLVRGGRGRRRCRQCACPRPKRRGGALVRHRRGRRLVGGPGPIQTTARRNDPRRCRTRRSGEWTQLPAPLVPASWGRTLARLAVALADDIRWRWPVDGSGGVRPDGGDRVDRSMDRGADLPHSAAGTPATTGHPNDSAAARTDDVARTDAEAIASPERFRSSVSRSPR